MAVDTPNSAEKLDPRLSYLVDQLQETRRELAAVRKHLGVDKPFRQRVITRAWQDRIRFLQALYEAGGTVTHACANSRVKRGKAYYNRDVSQLFADCWAYLLTHVLVHGNREPWSNVWPERLDDQEILSLAGISEELVPRLIAADVLEGKERAKAATSVPEAMRLFKKG